MARINIEESWWTDPRREKLSKLLGDELLADGAVIRLWRVAQEYWKDSEPIPNHLFDHIRFSQELITCGLAIPNQTRTKSNQTEPNTNGTEQDPTIEGYYVRGSTKLFEWLQKRKDAASQAGKKSAESRRKTKGTSQPLPNQTRTKSNEARTKSNQTEPSSSSSSSSSSSLSIKQESIGEGQLEIVGNSIVPVPVTKDLKANDKHSPPPNPHIGSFIGTYVKAYQSKYGKETRPDISGKVQGQIKTFLKHMPIERACQMIQVYLQMENDWFLKKGHDFTTFTENINPIGIALDTGTESQTNNKKINWNQFWGEKV